MNTYTGGPYQQAISGSTDLNNDWYDGKQYQTYAYEYSPGASGYVTWYVGQDKTYKLDARALRPNGNVVFTPPAQGAKHTTWRADRMRRQQQQRQQPQRQH